MRFRAIYAKVIGMTDTEELFSRGVASFIDPDNSFHEKVAKKMRGEYANDIVIKLGIDPTRPDIHLGHAVILRKLRAFQDAGCKVIFLIGDYTSLIGDPTGKSKTRPEISQTEIEANMKTYLDQVGKILSLDANVFSWMRNSDWFLDVTDIFQILHLGALVVFMHSCHVIAPCLIIFVAPVGCHFNLLDSSLFFLEYIGTAFLFKEKV